MLLIPTYIAESTIPGAGLGLFCREFVKEGTPVWAFVPGLDYVVATLPEHPLHREFVTKYGYMPLEGPPCWVMCADDARFFNHADRSNCIETDEATVAAHDIAPGTELTCDYTSFCRDPFAGFEKAGD
jgi:hypothetical protein